MTQYKKIKLDEEILRNGGIDCQEMRCAFRDTCANHTTAGDFRSEDGITPKLSILNGQIGCATFYADIDDSHMSNCKTYPVGCESDGALILNDGNIELAEIDF